LGSVDARIETAVAGYRIERLIGRGGMGAVYGAADDQLGRTVALKLLIPELSEDAGFRERFLRESRLAASLEHPNVVPIYQAGDADGTLYIAMEQPRAGAVVREVLARVHRDADRPHGAASGGQRVHDGPWPDRRPGLGGVVATITVGHMSPTEGPTTLARGLPDAVAVGEGAVWVLNGGDGTLSHVDPATNRVVETIRVGKDADSVAAGAGYVWVSTR
jgi:YVTN family beta-propeller protein